MVLAYRMKTSVSARIIARSTTVEQVAIILNVLALIWDFDNQITKMKLENIQYLCCAVKGI
jgi:hypothetical protein